MEIKQGLEVGQGYFTWLKDQDFRTRDRSVPVVHPWGVFTFKGEATLEIFQFEYLYPSSYYQGSPTTDTSYYYITHEVLLIPSFTIYRVVFFTHSTTYTIYRTKLVSIPNVLSFVV